MIAETAAHLRAHVTKLAAAPRNRVSAPDHLAKSRAYVTTALRRLGWEVDEQTFSHRFAFGISEGGIGKMLPFVIHRDIAGVNLIARRAGQATTGTLLIAHLDTVPTSPGADDNASGVAVLLEIARTLVERDETHDVTIAVVDLEEVGTLGSRHLLRQLKKVGALPSTVICFDSPGYFDTAPGSQRLPFGVALLPIPAVKDIKKHNNAGDFALIIHRPRSAQQANTLHKSAAAGGLRTVLLNDRRMDGHLQRFTRLLNAAAVDLDRSDHAPFWQARIPSIFVTGTATLRNRHYHQPTDTAETLDYSRLALIVESTATALSTI